MSEEQPNYLSYLLRLWRDGDKGATSWRASLQSSPSGKPTAFASLPDLFRFLQREVGGTCNAVDDNDDIESL